MTDGRIEISNRLLSEILSEMRTQTALMQSTHAMHVEAIGMQRVMYKTVMDGEADRKRQLALIDAQIAASAEAMKNAGIEIEPPVKN